MSTGADVLEGTEVHMGTEVSQARLGQHRHKAVILDGLQGVCVGLVAPVVYHQRCAASCRHPLCQLPRQPQALRADLQQLKGVPYRNDMFLSAEKETKTALGTPESQYSPSTQRQRPWLA